ncbi:MAG: hypothetical protein JSW07_20250 [bacterium]|nr:MAG: hypothetical protein JSW07_20250 [bacterium]
MDSWIKIFILLMTIKFFIGYFEIGNAQTTPQEVDTTRSTIKADTVRNRVDFIKVEGEIELVEINIEAVIEKPRVAILPKRVEPQLGEVEFIDRSFEKELKTAPDKPMIMDNRLFVPKKIEDLKQKLLKKKKKLEKNK